MEACNFLTFDQDYWTSRCFFKNQHCKITTAHGYLFYAHSKETKSMQNKPNPKDNKTHRCRKSVKQGAQQRAEKIVQHTVPDKNRSGTLSAMRSTRWETKDKREVEQAMRDEAETGRKGNE